MIKLIYGQRRPYLRFANEHDFFEAFGFLCNTVKHGIEFQWEYNAGSGAWGNEGRIHFLNRGVNTAYSPIPSSLAARLTAGRQGRVVHRINCNEFIKELVSVYGFRINPSKPGNAITRSAQGLIPPITPSAFVPQQYQVDYNRGFNM